MVTRLLVVLQTVPSKSAQVLPARHLMTSIYSANFLSERADHDGRRGFGCGMKAVRYRFRQLILRQRHPSASMIYDLDTICLRLPDMASM